MAALDYLLSSYRFARAENEIWIAEDNVDVRFFLSRAFKSAEPSLNLVFFRNGAELVEYFRLHSSLPRLILLDMEMPGMSGLEALTCIGASPKTPIVIFSSLENPELIRRAYHYGAKLYLRKPEKFEGFRQVAQLCVNCSEEIAALPAGRVPFLSLDARDALELVTPTQVTDFADALQDRAKVPLYSI